MAKFKIAQTGSYVGEAGYRVDGEKTLLRKQTPAIRGMPFFEKKICMLTHPPPINYHKDPTDVADSKNYFCHPRCCCSTTANVSVFIINETAAAQVGTGLLPAITNGADFHVFE